ncbi:hypothetical protein M3Y97_00522800 [Aphelenchoides bicaudatus]|nr:hypothetical protein M3Y97_00522800 [Aphelenchoides bicaudatus]
MTMHSEVKEVSDYFVRSLIYTVPRFKVNCFAQEFANSLLCLLTSEKPTESKDLLQNPEGYWIFRQMNYLCPMLMNVLNKCAISPIELMMGAPDVVYFKINCGMVSLASNFESKVINLAPFKSSYFEFPMRVLKVAIQNRINMLAYRHTFDGLYPNDFIPLALVDPKILGLKEKLPVGTQAFRAVGIPIYMFSAEQLNKTTFGSHNSGHVYDPPVYESGEFGPCGDGYRSPILLRQGGFLHSWLVGADRYLVYSRQLCGEGTEQRLHLYYSQYD